LSFGDYAVVSGKWSLPSETYLSNVIGTRSNEWTTRKFSFILTSKANDSVKVNGAMKDNLLTKAPLLPKIIAADFIEQIGTSEFSANIAVTGDTSHVWTLSMKTESKNQTAKYEAFLTDGKRNFLITPIGVKQYAIPAHGYEFTENDRFYSAYQFTGITRSLQHIYKIYLDKSLDPKMKLVLSGAMVALLALKD
jgi:aminopeptidase C